MFHLPECQCRSDLHGVVGWGVERLPGAGRARRNVMQVTNDGPRARIEAANRATEAFELIRVPPGGYFEAYAKFALGSRRDCAKLLSLFLQERLFLV